MFELTLLFTQIAACIAEPVMVAEAVIPPSATNFEKVSSMDLVLATGHTQILLLLVTMVPHNIKNILFLHVSALGKKRVHLAIIAFHACCRFNLF